MKGYKITGRGWAVMVVLLLLLALLISGVIKLISPLFREPEGNTPTPSPTLPDVLFTLPPTPADDGPSPSQSPASVTPSPEPSADPVVITAPPSQPIDPISTARPTDRPFIPVKPKPNPPPATATPKPTKKPSPSPKPTQKPTASPSPTVAPPPEWAEKTVSVLFLWNSSDMTDPEIALADLTELIPPPEDLAEYVIYIEGFKADDEETSKLAAKRAAAVETLLIEELGVDPAFIRTKAVSNPSILDRTLQRADISFKLTENK